MESILSAIRLDEEKNILSHMEGIINAQVIQKLLSIKDRNTPGGLLASEVKGNHLPLSEKIGSDIYSTCMDVQRSLGLGNFRIEYYIANDPAINASSIYNFNYSDSEPHYIIFNAGLLELLDNEERRFVTGHEIGHLFYEHSHFNRILRFLYPEPDKLPEHLYSCYDLWSKLGEISADRIGLIAAGRIDISVTALFKLSSGLGPKHINFIYSDLQAVVDELVGEMSGELCHVFSSHPANPVRIKALEAFSTAKTFHNIMNNENIEADPDLQEKTMNLVSVLMKTPRQAVEKAELELLASAGLYLASIDKDIDEGEVNRLVNILSRYIYMPQGYISALKEKALSDIMSTSASYISENHPERARGLFKQLLTIIIRDGRLFEGEVEGALKIAVDLLNIPPQEALDIMLEAIQIMYSPFS